MILQTNRYLCYLLSLLFILFCHTDTLYGQNNSNSGSIKAVTEKSNSRQDTVFEQRKKKVSSEEPDTNFTYEKYAAFLNKISDTSKYLVLPINEFRNTFNSNKIIIGLRHDVDIDLNIAFQFSETESKLGFRSTYYILHTAPYYLANATNMAIHSENIIPVLKKMQNERHFEIGWHNDLVTLQAVYNINPVTFLSNELSWLRSNGINIYGSASHGSNYCYTYKYLNYYFFEECTYPVVGQFVNNLTLPINGTMEPMKKGKFSDFNLEYEAYFINNNKYFSDASITNGIRWNIGMLNINQLQAGDRVIILLHPVHWHKASISADMESFHITGQQSSSIDAGKSTISVRLPYGADRNSLKADFILSPGAYAKASGKMQMSGSTLNSFVNPVVYSVFAENREIRKNWVIEVNNALNSVSNFESFVIPGLTRSVNINPSQKTIYLQLNDGTDLKNLPVQFELSPGAKAWIDNVEQFSNKGTINLSNSVEYKVLAEDGISSSIWTVIVLQNTIEVEDIESAKTGLTIYPNPSNGIIHLQFRNITTSPSRINIFNSGGEEVYSDLTTRTGSFEVDADISKFAAGVYFLKYSHSEKPIKIIIQK
jgi:hypothetical protein